MNFWASGFWAEGFWSPGFWGGEVEPPVVLDVSQQIGGRKSQSQDDELLIAQVIDKWETIERARQEAELPQAATAIDTAIVPAVAMVPAEALGADAAITTAIPAMIDREVPLSARSIDVALPPLLPDQAKAAIEAKRTKNSQALLMLLMDL